MATAHKKFSLLKLFKLTNIRKWFWDVRNDKLALEALGVKEHAQCFDLQLCSPGGCASLASVVRGFGLPGPDPTLQNEFKADVSPLVAQRDARGRLPLKWIHYAADGVRHLLRLKTEYKLDGLPSKKLRRYKTRWP